MEKKEYCLSKRKRVNGATRNVFLLVEDGTHFATIFIGQAKTFESKEQAVEYKKEHKLRGWQPEQR